MTAQNIIDSSKHILTGFKVKETDSTLLSFLNLAKNQLATDTLFWLDGEVITLSPATYEYTLSKTPIQIIDVYDSLSNLRPRNSSDTMGYYQTSPNKIYVTSPGVSSEIKINYYYTPNDYTLSSEIDIPPGLHNAIQYFLAHKSYEMQKGEANVMSSKEYFARYNASVKRYLSVTDNGNLDTVMEVDMIKDKGLV